MKFISNLFEEISFDEGKCHAFYFQQNETLWLFRQQLADWLLRKELEQGRFFLLNEEQELTSKDIEVLELVGGSNLEIPYKIVTLWVKFQLQNEPELAERFESLRVAIEQFFFTTTLHVGPIQIDFDMQENYLDTFLKLAKLEISTEELSLSKALIFRQATVQLWEQLIFSTKPKFLFYMFPECDGQAGEFVPFIELLESLGITTIFITNSIEFLRLLPIEQVSLIKTNGSTYDLCALKEELRLFEMVEDVEQMDSVVIELAARLMIEDYLILDQKYSRFLKSEKY